MDADRSQTSDTSDQEITTADDPASLEVSQEFVGRWDNLISRTNWEKGRIISQWREALVNSGSAQSTYSDESWSRRVGGVTPQHVGRLRRVYDRFSSSYESFDGLYWSHFLAALDWDDAELWLEGASRSGWSVSKMRRMRWESMGSDPAQEPRAGDIESTSMDEDFTPLSETDAGPNIEDGPRSVMEGPRAEDPDFGDEADYSSADDAADDDVLPWEPDSETQESPFTKLPSLPVDLSEAVEQFKLAIIRHRSDSWSEVSQADVIKALDALKAFAGL